MVNEWLHSYFGYDSKTNNDSDLDTGDAKDTASPLYTTTPAHSCNTNPLFGEMSSTTIIISLIIVSTLILLTHT